MNKKVLIEIGLVETKVYKFVEGHQRLLFTSPIGNKKLLNLIKKVKMLNPDDPIEIDAPKL